MGCGHVTVFLIFGLSAKWVMLCTSSLICRLTWQVLYNGGPGLVMSGSCDYLFIVWDPLCKFGLGEAKHFKFCTKIDSTI